MVTYEPLTGDAAATTLDTARSDARFSEDPEQSTDLDAVFAALRHPRRRYVLAALADRDGAQSLSRLATDLAAWEDDQPREAVSADARDRCRIALHHVHLPKLAALGLVDYDLDGEPTVRAADANGVQAVVDGFDGELDATQELARGRDGA